MLAYHAAFDAGMIHRAYRSHDLSPLNVDWLDIEPLARLFGGNSRAKALDDWLAHFHIECVVRHEAGDANVARGDTFGQRSCLDSFLIILSNIKKINPSFVLECFFDMMQGY